MSNNESVGKKIVEALKKQAESMDAVEDTSLRINEDNSEDLQADLFTQNNDIFAEEPKEAPKKSASFFDDVEEVSEPFYSEPKFAQNQVSDMSDNFEMPANIAVLKKLISQLPSGVSRHTGAQIIKQTMEALGISMKSVLQDIYTVL